MHREDRQQQADEQQEPIQPSEPIPQTPSRSAPSTDEPAPVPVDPPTDAPVPAVAADPAERRVPVEREDRDEQPHQDDVAAGRDGPVAEAGEERERPALLGRLTEPLGVTCGGLLRRGCG
jgi:hypothetical protein